MVIFLVLNTNNYSYGTLGRLDRLTDGNGNLIVDYDYHIEFGCVAIAKWSTGNYHTPERNFIDKSRCMLSHIA
ncbi:MAG: hypothetical protein ACFCAD_13745 [Pleurocapsa sp.]